MQVDLFTTIFYTASSILQLETRSRGGGYQRTSTELVQYQGICTPSMVSDSRVLLKVRSDKGNSCANHPFVANPSVVPNITGTTSGLPSPATSSTAGNNSFLSTVWTQCRRQNHSWLLGRSPAKIQAQTELLTSSSVRGEEKKFKLQFSMEIVGRLVCHMMYLSFFDRYSKCVRFSNREI